MTGQNNQKENPQKKFSGFYKLTSLERLKKIQEEIPTFTEKDSELLLNTGSLNLETVNRMIENAVGVMPVPLGIAVNFLINQKEYLVPLAIEEPSVIAAACSAAKLVRAGGGFTTSTTPSIMIGQIQILNVTTPQEVVGLLLENKAKILEISNANHPSLISHGGGAKDLRVKILDTRIGKMVICELLVDCCDAMGANTVSAMAEEVSPFIEELTKGEVLLRILSNLADQRLARASCIVPKDLLGGEQVVDAIVAASAFAEADPYRATTHNKGIMNGISALILATANDTRAIEAGAHAFAARNGQYTALATWTKNDEGDLVGEMELPVAVGIIGGATKTNPVAQIALKILDITKASELAQVAAAVGLAQNLGALRALTTTGIIKGHMRLHAKNVAISAGATGTLIEKVAKQMIEEKNVKFSRAQELLKKMKEKN
ncbi:MAG: hydroxymethylglutaryl-CoA reductase, degradative [Candidatus Heimdallarchaeota archaeon]|nr:hydroxymethylglutaryl-CoA reductase, degradative [Candidatus Heimdallarchaeota archaeon]